MKEYITTYGVDQNISYIQVNAVGNINVVFTDLEYGDVVHSITGLAPLSPGNYNIVFPGSVNTLDRQVKMSVTYTAAGPVTRTESFGMRFRRPYATAAELATEFGLEIVNTTPADDTEILAATLEAYERFAFERINGITMNYFNKAFHRENFYGTGHDSIPVDENIIAVEKVWKNGDLAFDSSAVDPYPYGLRFFPGQGSSNFFVEASDTSSVISDPDGAAKFGVDDRYTIQYINGYEEVPAAIYQATVLAVNELMCNEYGQRNHYVIKQETPFGKLEYDPRTFNGFGNVTIDQLLTQYCKMPMQVI